MKRKLFIAYVLLHSLSLVSCTSTPLKDSAESPPAPETSLSAEEESASNDTGGQALSPYEKVDTIEGIWIEAKPGTVTPTGVEVEFHNTTEQTDLLYGLGYCGVEKREDDSWYELPCLNGVFTGNDGPSIGFQIYGPPELEALFADAGYDPDGGLPWDSDSELPWRKYPPNTMGYSWESDYGELPPGEYRIIVDVSAGSGKTLTTYYLTAEFQIV